MALQEPKTPAPKWDRHELYRAEKNPKFSRLELSAYLSGWGHHLDAKQVELIKQWIIDNCEAGQQQIQHCEEMSRIRKNPLSVWPNNFKEFCNPYY